MSIFSRHEQSTVLQNESVIAEVRNASKTYAGALAVNNVSLDVHLGEFIILTGHSGSGKSTVLGMLEGVVVPDAGDVVLFGQSLNHIKDKQLKKIKEAHIGIGFQAALLDRGHTVANVVKQTANANHIKVDNKRVVELAARFRMLDKLSSQTGGLSGGEQMRVSMMRALATRPDLILLDEPTGAIETKGKADALQVLREIVTEEQATVVMVTHDPDIARAYADREYVLESGELIDTVVYSQFQPPTDSRLNHQVPAPRYQSPNVS
ncbi:MAG: ATP-binding cassette domain-containing protein [Patescibacteria group bacterium]|nr:ATP-binding cassette domain-containing protein [Patescibacteria group bacterium]